MVYTKGKMKGQLTTAEIRKLISAHNKLSKITIPPKSKRDDILKILKDNGFSVNHERQRLEQIKVQRKNVDLEQAKEITKRKPRAKPVPKPKPKPEPLPKEDEVRPKEKVGRPKVDPKKIQVIKPKPKEEKPKPKKKVLAIEDKPKQEKPKRNFKVNSFERKKMLSKLIDDTGGRMIKLHKVIGIKSSDETPELVKKKCKELKLKFHPDKNNEPDQDKFDLVQKVCRILLDTQEIIKDKPKEEPKVEKPKKEPKVDKDGIPQLKRFDVIEYRTKGNKKVMAFVSETLSDNKYRMNHIILKDDGSFSEDEKDTMDLPDIQLSKSRKFKFIGKLDPDQEKVIFEKEPDKALKKPTKKEIVVAFKDIITGFKEILQEVITTETPDAPEFKKEIKKLEAIEDKLKKGSLSFPHGGQPRKQFDLITRALDAYIDLFQGDPDNSDQINRAVEIAKELKIKYRFGQKDPKK